MICETINGPSLADAIRQVQHIHSKTKLVEFRLDRFLDLSQDSLTRLKNCCSLPIMFTLRTTFHGGKYEGTERVWLQMIRFLATLKPSYFDLESHLPSPFIDELMQNHPDIQWIVSHHQLNPDHVNLEEIYMQIKQIPSPFYKIAVNSKKSLDALRMLSLVRASKGRLIGIVMGAEGRSTRILGPIFGAPIIYACHEEDAKNDIGQLTVQDLVNQFRIQTFDSSTSIYGLIGDPVDQSISEETHNTLIEAFNWNAVYLKWSVKESDLKDFLELAVQLNFSGLSVTMPLKEVIIPLLDRIDTIAEIIGAVNTILINQSLTFGFNTDCTGALIAIEQTLSVSGKKIAVIGSGGAAKAIIYEACKRGAEVMVLSRHPEKAAASLKNFSCTVKSVEGLAFYDILINCTPNQMPIKEEYVLQKALFFDITTKPKETLFLRCAIKNGCKVIYGYQMFIEQAIEQFSIWRGSFFDVYKARAILNEASLSVL